MRPLISALLLLAACGDETGLSTSVTPTDAPPEPSEPARLRFIELGAELLPEALPGPRRAPVSVDWEGDGDRDLVVLTPAGVSYSLWQDGAFEVERSLDLGEGAVDLLPIDVDGDGASELLLLGGAEADQLLSRSREARVWTSQALPAGSRAGVVGDLDGDGHADALVSTSEGLRWWRGDGVGLAPASLSGLADPLAAGTDLALADMDGDGHLDLVTSQAAGRPALWLGDGAGAFLRAPAELILVEEGAGGLVHAGDMDGDGDTDLVVAGTGTARLLLQEAGRWTDSSELALPRSLGTAVALHVEDLDGDAHPEVVMAHAEGAVSLWRADGAGRWFDYSDVVHAGGQGAGATGLLVTDLDGDGASDLYLPRDDLRRPRLWRAWPTERADGDGDGVPDEADVCPQAWDPEQANRDTEPFACEGTEDCLDRTGCRLFWLEGAAWLTCSTPRSWSEATAACEARGARLMVPESDEESLDLLAEGVGGWVGISDRQAEGSWVHTGGEALDYAPWAEGEPNDAGDGEDCAQLREDGLWNDLPCDRSLPFTCVVREPFAAVDPGDACDVCPDLLDDQTDSDGDGVGDACDAS